MSTTAASEVPAHHAEKQGHDLDPEPSSCNRMFILSAIFVFLAVAVSSIPNVLSAHHAKGDSLRAVAASSSVGLTSSPSLDLKGSLQQAGGSLVQNCIKCTPGVHTESGSKDERENRVFDNSRISSPPTASRNLNDVKDPSATPPLSHPRHENSHRESLVQGIELWPLMQATAWLGFRTSMWFLSSSFHAVKYVVAKPIHLAVALAERPYIVTRDICKAFLPVYSFFSAAAMIGVIIGVVALWIAQVLISAIGADQDKGYQGLAPETSLHSTSHAFSRTRVRKGSTALQGTTSLTEARQTAGRGLRDPMTEKPRQLASSVPRSGGFANQKGDMATNEYEPQDDDDEDEDEDDDDDDDDDDDEDDDDEGWSHA